MYTRFFISCMGYPECKNAIWLPDYVLEAVVQEEICDTVSSVVIATYTSECCELLLCMAYFLQ